MKKIILLSIVIFSALSFQQSNTCGIKGDGKNARMQVNDSLKNRALPTSAVIDSTITLDSLLRSGNDVKRFSAGSYVSLVGYISLVKYGGSETCNCHATNKQDLDIHIELVKYSTNTSINAVIVEITRFTKNKTDLSYDVISKLKGKQVKIDGYLFFDDEHKQNARNTNPEGTFIWRATCWEVHPVCSVKLIQ